MTNRVEIRRIPALLTASLLVTLGACGKKEEAKPKSSGSGGMRSVESAPARASASNLRMHPKVQFPDERLPNSQEAAQAIADLASAIASGSADGLDALVSPADRLVLDMLVSSGEWKRRSDAVKVVRVCVYQEPTTGTLQVGLGVENDEGAFLMGWGGTGVADKWSFANLPIEPRLAQEAVGLDGAELKMLGLPSGIPAPDSTIKPDDAKKEGGEEKKNKPKAPPKPKPGGLIPDRF